MIVQFSIIPVGKGSSISRQVARVLKIVDSSGLPYKINPMGTVIEGSWDRVMGLIKKCHTDILRHELRVLTTITIDDRKKKRKMINEKVRSVEKKLGKSLKK
jgi:uncharacterized protein (TIGR00106 family)